MAHLRGLGQRTRLERAGIAAAGCLPGCGCNPVFTRRRGVTATIGREELEAKIARRGDIVLVETLDPEYYEDAHLPGAVNLPLDKIGELAPDILPDKDADIVVYCMSSL